MHFPSKKDIWFFLMFWGIILFIVLIYLFGSEPVGYQLITYKSILGYIIAASVIGLLKWLWFRTGYRVEDGLLKVQSGPFKSSIKIADIKKLRKKKSPFTAPALSVDRIEIMHGSFDIMDVSPKNKDKFIRSLLAENPSIQLDPELPGR